MGISAVPLNLASKKATLSGLKEPAPLAASSWPRKKLLKKLPRNQQLKRLQQKKLPLKRRLPQKRRLPPKRRLLPLKRRLPQRRRLLLKRSKLGQTDRS